MTSTTSRLLAAALFAALATTACKRDAQAPATTGTPSPAEAPATAPAPLPPAAPATPPPASGATVSNVELGNAIGGDNRVTTAMTTFSPRDTIYATVTVDGAGAGQLGARWTFQDGQEVHSETKALTAGGPTTHEFHVSKPDGWPAGRYRVEIRLDGNTVQTRDFEVR